MAATEIIQFHLWKQLGYERLTPAVISSEFASSFSHNQILQGICTNSAATRLCSRAEGKEPRSRTQHSTTLETPEKGGRRP